MIKDTMKDWNIERRRISKFFKLKNGQWMKIIFNYNKNWNIWFETIIVANTKRICNDCVYKANKSPKRIYGQHTGKKAGVEPFLIALKALKEFEKTISNTEINIIGATDELDKIYKYLKRYGYKEDEFKNTKGKIVKLLYKNIK